MEPNDVVYLSAETYYDQEALNAFEAELERQGVHPHWDLALDGWDGQEDLVIPVYDPEGGA